MSVCVCVCVVVTCFVLICPGCGPDVKVLTDIFQSG